MKNGHLCVIAVIGKFLICIISFFNLILALQRMSMICNDSIEVKLPLNSDEHILSPVSLNFLEVYDFDLNDQNIETFKTGDDIASIDIGTYVYTFLKIHCLILWHLSGQQKYSTKDYFDKIIDNDPFNIENETGITIFIF